MAKEKGPRYARPLIKTIEDIAQMEIHGLKKEEESLLKIATMGALLSAYEFSSYAIAHEETQAVELSFFLDRDNAGAGRVIVTVSLSGVRVVAVQADGSHGERQGFIPAEPLSFMYVELQKLYADVDHSDDAAKAFSAVLKASMGVAAGNWKFKGEGGGD